MNLETAQHIWEQEAKAHGYSSFIIIAEDGLIARIFCSDEEEHARNLEIIDVSNATLISEIWI